MKISALPGIYKMNAKTPIRKFRIGVFLLSIQADSLKAAVLQNVDLLESNRFQKLRAIVEALLQKITVMAIGANASTPAAFLQKLQKEGMRIRCRTVYLY